MNCVDSPRLEELLDQLFSVLSVRRCQAGPRFLASAIRLAVEDPVLLLQGLTTRIYPLLAEQYHTGVGRIQRAIRKTLDLCYKSGRVPEINKLLGLHYFDENYHPTSLEFIAIAADKISILLKGA